jgi:hypothetical protein
MAALAAIRGDRRFMTSTGCTTRCPATPKIMVDSVIIRILNFAFKIVYCMELKKNVFWTAGA